MAAHDWDVWGAMRVGCEAAYVARSVAPFTRGRPPQIVGPDLAAVAEEILHPSGRSWGEVGTVVPRAARVVGIWVVCDVSR